jgi:dipeptidyl-peptidase 4
MYMTNLRWTTLPVLTLGFFLAPAAQGQRQVTAQDYAAAEKFMPYNTNPLAYKGQIEAHWADDGHFWYRAVDDEGVTYILADPAQGTRGPAFDQEKLAALLHGASNGAIRADGRHLAIDGIAITGEHEFTLTIEGAIYQCSLGAGNDSCARIGRAGTRHGVPHGAPHGAEEAPLAISPDRRLGAFIRDWNLWVRNLDTGAETQLTTDGSENSFNYPQFRVTLDGY